MPTQAPNVPSLVRTCPIPRFEYGVNQETYVSSVWQFNHDIRRKATQAPPPAPATPEYFLRRFGIHNRTGWPTVRPPASYLTLVARRQPIPKPQH